MKQKMDISERGLQFIEGWELYVGYIYDDKVAPQHINGKLVYKEWDGGPVRGTLTQGFGHTKSAKAVVDWSVGAKITRERAREVLHIDLSPVIACINRLVKVALTQGQFDALCSLVFNIGETLFAKSTVLRKLNRGDYRGARAALDLYVKSKGEYMVGLQRRRDAEQELWDELDQVTVPSEEAPVHHSADIDPPKRKSMAKSSEGWTSIAQTVGGSAGIGNQSIDAYDAADKIIEAKAKAEALGVEPIKVFDKLNATLSILIHQPAFWFCLAIVVAGVFLWLRRRWKLQGEM